MISTDTISKITETAQIEEVIGEFLSLKKRGVNLIGLCPFHDEKTPSFTVSPAKGIYKCFGCGAAGNSVKFVMEHESYSYPEALKYLAEKYNIGIEEDFAGSSQQKESQEAKDSLYIVNAFAQRYYSEILFDHEEGKSIGLSYFKERGFREDAIRKFQLGYALDSEQYFTAIALEKGYKPELLQKAGLTSMKGDRQQDFFKNRVMFAIHNLSGKVIGFGGRTLKSDKKIPKYINTPESEIYHKSKILYGIFFAKNAIRKEDNCLLVEGYTDVVSLAQAGIENVVASSGTSLTPDQVKLIKRLTNNITILYDGDPAGIKAALRGIDLILEEDMNVKIVLLPESEDPDSLIKNIGATEFKKFIEQQSRDFIFFKTDILVKESEKDPPKRAEAIKEIVSSIALIPDAIKRALFTKECSKLLDVDEQILVTETNKLRRGKLAKRANVPREEVDAISPDIPAAKRQYTVNYQEGFALQERDIIRLLFEYGQNKVDEQVSVAEVILHELEDLEFENEDYNKVIKEYKNAVQNVSVLDQQHFLNHPDKAISELAIEILHVQYEISENWNKMHDIIVTDKKFLYKRDIKSSICRFKLKRLDNMIEEYRKLAKENVDADAISKYQVKKMQLDEKRKQLANDLGTVTVK